MNNLKPLAAKWIEQHPFLEEIGATYLCIYDVLQKYKAPIAKDIDWDIFKDDIQNGVPILRSGAAEIVDYDFAADIFYELTRLAFNECLPAEFCDKIIVINSMLDKNKKLAIDILKTVSQSDVTDLESMIKDSEANLGVVSFFAWIAIAFTIEPYLPSLMKWVEENNWQEAYCPTCGSEPVMAELKKTKKGRTRFLSCGACKTKWSYKRIGCPYCGNTDQESLGLIEVEEEGDIRIDLCDKCESYLKTYIGLGMGGIELEDWSSVHIDVICNGTKYKKHGAVLIAK